MRESAATWLALAGWIALALLAGAIGAAASVNAREFYAGLARPAWAPPGWLFGPVWTTLYVLMGVAAWLVWRERAAAPGRHGLPGRLRRPPGSRRRVHDPVGGHAPRQGADGRVFERPRGPQGNLDGLFVELGPGDAVVAYRGDVQNPEPDLMRYLPPGSKSVTSGEPSWRTRVIAFLQLAKNPESESPRGFFANWPVAKSFGGFGRLARILCFERERLGYGGKRGGYDRAPGNGAETLGISV